MSSDIAGSAPLGGATIESGTATATYTRAAVETPRTLVVHVGLPKAASSYLHVDVFPQVMGGHYVMPGAANAKKSAYRFPRNRFGVRRFSDAFQKDAAFWAAHGQAFLRQYMGLADFETTKPRSLLISDEAVTRVNHYGVRNMPAAFDPGALRANLRGLYDSARGLGFDRVRLMLMTRRQDTLLAASYVQQSRKIPRASQADFERRVQTLLSRSNDDLSRQFFGIDYGRLFDCFADVVGAENVSVMPIELIGPEFDVFIDEMRRVLDVDNTHLDLSQAPVNARSRTANRWGLRPLLLYKSRHSRVQLTVPTRLSGRASEIELTEPLAAAIRDHFDSENRRLAEMTGLDLAAYGYHE
ncbi:hypothetical protein [Salinisphaera sp. Q1T1-3]|uniref:hypothetical protein n=1 Tax=Salinisphaera sp. Q1T1-3 TaxID=2321229 RepID=UPI000E7517DC|nr:hypothetical protein [Salinisphaera sp. Q1T1-3]RJS92833.1 hypothetical protein D3260_09745 [Salinisphaera sp. Q1T1-3]